MLIEFIIFILKHKITYLYLLLYLTNLLKILDVYIFDSLMQNCKKLLFKKIRFSNYNINKNNFISIIQ